MLMVVEFITGHLIITNAKYLHFDQSTGHVIVGHVTTSYAVTHSLKVLEIENRNNSVNRKNN